MNRTPVNGPKKTNELSVRKNRDECDTNSTDSFDMNEFKTSSLNKKYSVPIHKNKADLMAELSNINIMGDESDVELVEPSKVERNGLHASVSVSDRNSSKITDRSLNTTNSSGDTQPNGELAIVKQERIFAWAQSQSQNLSMCVASILSDHDYLSQENLIGIITGNEENTEIEINSQKQREISENVNSNNDLAKEQTIDSQATIFYQSETNGNAMQNSPPNDIDNLSAMMDKLKQSKETQHVKLLDEIVEKANQMKRQLIESGEPNKMEDSKASGQNESNTPDFSSNHSEPMEHYGGVRFSAQSSVDETKESDGDEMVVEAKKQLKTVDDIANRISVDTKSIRDRLATIESQPEAERTDAIDKLRENFGLLIDDIANELTKIAVQLNPKLTRTEAAPNQKTHNKKERNHPMSDSTEEYECSEPIRSRKFKKRRKVARSGRSVSASSDLSSNSEESPLGKDKPKTPENKPYVMTQNVDDLMNGGASNSANESLTKENDLLGFDDAEIGIKTEIMLNSEQISSQKNATNETSQMDTETSKDKSVVNSQNTNNMSAMQEMDRSSSSSSFSDKLGDDDDDDDEEDENVRKLCDLSSLVTKRIPLSNDVAATRSNGKVEPKKPVKKVPKEDEMAKFLANSDDTDLSKVESEDEKFEREEYTEEQYLKEQNEKLKMQLLEDSSNSEPNYDDSDNDDGPGMNGKGSDLSISDDDKPTSDSDVSIMEQFLKDESNGNNRKSPKGSENPDKETPKETKSGEEEEDASPEPKTKEPSPKKRPMRIDRFDVSASDSDVEYDDESGSVSLSDAPRKTMSTVGKHVFRSIEKEQHITIPSDDEDASGSETKKKPAGKLNSEAGSSGNSEILDTSDFKESKKDFNPKQLSRILQTNRNKQPTARVSPECISVSSDDDIEMESTSANKKDENEDDDEDKEKRIKRKLLRPDQLTADTKIAQKEEQERIRRLDRKIERLTQYITESQKLSQEDTESQDSDPNEVILDISKKNDKIAVHPEITKHLKPHQVEGIKFMYDCCYGSVDNLDKFPGSGCILAHCMGLGKTLQLITLLHTVICNPQLKTDKVLVICPKSTVMNWKDEIERWLSPIKNTRKLKLFHFPEQSDINAKLRTLSEWSQCGKDGNKQAGCLLLGYEAFRVLVFYHNSKKSQATYSNEKLEKLSKSIHKYLLDPGADLVVCDEGHMIKNQKSTTSMAVNQIITKRRIVLTGTPIQNNLKEYYSMVNFIKPSFLGTEKEFANLYVNPIKNGQHKDSSKSEIKYMKQRSYVLHKKLSRFVQRKEAALLKSFLPAKFEYVLFIPMTEIQTSLYEFFLENRPNQDQKGKSLIPDYTVLRKIWTHPKVLENAYLNALSNKTKVKPPVTPANINDSDDDQPDDVFDSQTGQMSVTSDWWRSHLKQEDLETILPSNKLKIVFEILNQCRQNNEKCLIFSAFVAVLDVVEFFMRLINKQERDGNKPGLEKYRGPWVYGEDYYRLDGKTPKNQRHNMITSFNRPANVRTRVFLISAKAGGQGINLIGANRVILLDTSWNPSNDQQNIFRVFRLGQKRICYIYRLISMGTMEEKVYSRSVTKQAMSCRVMDVQQIDRHYNMAELTELYILTKPNMDERPTPNLPKDDLLKYLLKNFPQMVYKYHEHDSLLENKGEEELSEQEKNDAWAAYEEDVKRKNETNMGPYSNNFGGMLPNYPALGTYANSLFNSYNNLSGVSGQLNYPYNNMYSQYPYSSDSHWQFNDYTSFYNNLMTMGQNRSSMTNYNQTSPSLLSPNHSSSVSSPPPPIMNMNNFTSSRNWMQNASSSNYANSLLASLAQTSPSSKNYSSYLNSLYNALGTNNAAAAAAAASANASTSKTPPLPLTSSDFNQLAFLQKQNMANLPNSTTPQPSTSSAQQGPNALRNPLLTKELSIPRNPIGAKDLFNLPIATSVITKTTTSSTASLSSISSAIGNTNLNEVSKSSSRSPELSITSSVDRASKNTMDNQLIIKDVRTINESRDSPDTTGHNQNKANSDKDKAASGSVSNGVSSTVSALAESSKKANKSPNVVTPISTNMGIVYPARKTTTQTASTSNIEPGSSVLISTQTRANEKESPRKTMSTVPGATLSRNSNQPVAAIIRKPIPSNTKSNDPTNDAVAAINKNKALTVTARSVVVPSASKTPPVTDVNNSITLSPIPIVSPKFSGGSISIAKTNTIQGRTQSPLSKTASPVPVALSKVNINHGQTTITKTPAPALKTNGLGSRNTNTNPNSNTLKVSTAIPKTPNVPAQSNTRPAGNNPSISPKVFVSSRSSQSFKPIIAQTKTNALSVQNSNKPSANNSPAFQVKRVISKTNPTLPPQSSSALANRLGARGVEIRKRPAEPMQPQQIKRLKPLANNSLASSSSTTGSPKSQNPLQGIRVSPRQASQPLSSQITPVEIVELE